MTELPDLSDPLYMIELEGFALVEELALDATVIYHKGSTLK